MKPGRVIRVKVGRFRHHWLSPLAIMLAISFMWFAGVARSESGAREGSTLPSNAISLQSPLDYQVFQRSSLTNGTITIRGHLIGIAGQIEYRIIEKASDTEGDQEWKPLEAPIYGEFRAEVPAAAGGWKAVEVRVVKAGDTIAQTRVGHVGVGEVFLVAGQSNSANHGAEKQQTLTGMVVSFNGSNWALAKDPQPGASGDGGSFIPAFGDALAAKYRVPIGVASVGVGATSVRQWLPKGERMTNQPSTTDFIKPARRGEWESDGQLFDKLMERALRLGTNGFRAILWHQGESDAGQARSGYPLNRQISGNQYRTFMEKVIRFSRQRAGWTIPWFVAQATYHNENDPADEEFRAAQKSLWTDNTALEGPDTDALRLGFRDGVHFNGKGLKAHGALWADKVGAYLETLRN